MSTVYTCIYVVACKRNDGRPPGMEKACDGRFYYTYEDAETARGQLIGQFGVFPVYCEVQEEQKSGVG